jgi:hypothetical protein
VGDILTVKLDEAPNFEAFSYTWGTSDKTILIKIGTRGLLVPPHLAVALQYLREPAAKDESKKLYWVDQVCINQSNNVERGEQVQLMREIYQRASHTTIWLEPNSQSIQTHEDRLFSKVQQELQEDRKIPMTANYLVAGQRSAGIPEDGD